MFQFWPCLKSRSAALFFIGGLLLLFSSSGALAQLQRLTSDNKQAIKQYEQGLALAERDDFNGALAKLRAAIDLDPNFLQAHLRYMDAFRSVGRENEVAGMYRNLLERNPGSAFFHFLYGRALHDPDAKRAEYKKTLVADPSFYLAQYDIGGSYLLEQRYDEAIVSLNKVLDINPKMVEAQKLLASVYLEKSMPFQARRLLKTALGLEPKNGSLYFRLGQALSQLELYEGAEQAFLRAIELNPDEPMIYYYIGLLYEIGGSQEKAINTYRKFLELSPKHELAVSARQNIKSLQAK